MFNVKIIYNSLDNKIFLEYENNKITSSENRIYEYISAYDFSNILMPFRKRYSIWEGLLPELIKDVNDSELDICFEGRAEDYEMLVKAFAECKGIVESLGYKNLWTVSHMKNFESENLINMFIQTADDLYSECRTRDEQHTVHNLKINVNDDNINESCEKLKEVLVSVMQKWEESPAEYKQSKIDYLKSVSKAINKICKEAEVIKRRDK